MATTKIELDIENLTGIADADNEFIVSAQKTIVASIPNKLLQFAVIKSSAIQDDNGFDISSFDSIESVERNGYPAEKVSFSLSKLVSNSASLHYATNSFPVWFHVGGKVFIKPSPAAGGSDDGYVYYVDYAQIDDDCDLRNIVVFYATAKEFTKLATDLAPSWTSPSLPVPPTSPNFGGDLSITSTPPSIPVLSSTTIDEGGLTVPIFTPPIMSAPDWSGIDNLITSEENTGMVDARIKAVQSKVSEYGARLKEAQLQFEKESTEYGANLQIAIENAKLESADDVQLVQKYSSELNVYQQNISKEVQDFVNTLNKNVQEYQSNIAKYSAELQAYQLEITEQTAEKAIIQQKIKYYNNQAIFYSKIAIEEIQQYIKSKGGTSGRQS